MAPALELDLLHNEARSVPLGGALRPLGSTGGDGWQRVNKTWIGLYQSFQGFEKHFLVKTTLCNISVSPGFRPPTAILIAGQGCD